MTYEWKSMLRVNVILIYFAFTSVSTVGFGDYTPKSICEKLLISIFLFCGVNIFSIVARDFLKMLTSYNKFHEVYEDSKELNLFFGVIRRFNWNMPLDELI